MAKVKQITPQNVDDAEFQEISKDETGEEIPKDEIWEDDATLNDVMDDIKDHSNSTKNTSNSGEPETKTNENKGPADPPKEPINKQLGGEFLLLICDKAVPSALKFGVELFSKRKKVDIKKLSLDYDEKEMLRPSAEITAQILFEKMTPVQQFLLGYAVIISSKLADAVTDKDEK